MKYLAMGPLAYGFGDTIKAAKAECRKHFPSYVKKSKRKMRVYRIPDGMKNPRIDGMGSLHWDCQTGCDCNTLCKLQPELVEDEFKAEKP